MSLHQNMKRSETLGAVFFSTVSFSQGCRDRGSTNAALSEHAADTPVHTLYSGHSVTMPVLARMQISQSCVARHHVIVRIPLRAANGPPRSRLCDARVYLQRCRARV